MVDGFHFIYNEDLSKLGAAEVFNIDISTNFESKAAKVGKNGLIENIKRRHSKKIRN